MALRENYITGEYTLISLNRRKPNNFKYKKEEISGSGFCPFCQEVNPNILNELIENGDKFSKYGILCAINLFPFLDLDKDKKVLKFDSENPDDDVKSETCGSLGKHELIIETSNHDEIMADMSELHIKRVIDTYAWRLSDLFSMDDINYAMIYKNHGKTSGASQRHEHSQVAAFNIIPKKIVDREIQSYSDNGSKCKYCRMVEIESKSSRNIYTDENVVAFCSFAPKTSYEVRILPRRHVLRLDELTEDERLSLAKTMKLVTGRLRDLGVDYNFFIHSGFEKMHLNITFRTRGIMPWGGIEWGGLELCCGVHVVSVPPEAAAKFYRGEEE